MKNIKTEINDANLENVTGGTESAPFLPPETLKPSEYSGMFSSTQDIGQKEFHFYNNKVEDPSSFTTKTHSDEKLK